MPLTVARGGHRDGGDEVAALEVCGLQELGGAAGSQWECTHDDGLQRNLQSVEQASA